MDELQRIIKAARQQSWRVERTKKGHLAFYPPDRSLAPEFAAGTPSDWRSNKNLIAGLRRKGFVWPWPPEPTKREER